MMCDYVIFSPCSDPSQSGGVVQRPEVWVVAPAQRRSCYINPITGWYGSDAANERASIQFNSIDEALFYAKANGLKYKIMQPHRRKMVKKSYQENFIQRDK